MKTIHETFGSGNPKIYKFGKIIEYPDLPIINSKEIIGIEIEVENFDQNRNPNPVWQIKEDGSLRNRGVEWVTKPITADMAPWCIKELSEAMTKEVSFNMRTSVHVHLNVGDLTEQQVKLLVAFYMLYERDLFNFVGKGRWKSVYCVPLNESSEWLMHSIRAFGGEVFWSKYTALNLKRIAEIGTVEFRHMHGTCDVDKLSKWVGMICNLKEFIKKESPEELNKLLFSNLTPQSIASLAQTIFGDHEKYLKIGVNKERSIFLMNAKVGLNKHPRPILIFSKSNLYKLMV